MIDEYKEKRNVEVIVKAGDLISTHFQRSIEMLEQVDAEEGINRESTTFKMLAFLAFFYLNASCMKKSKIVLISNQMRFKKQLFSESIEKIAENQAILLRLFEKSLLINFQTLWNGRDIDTQFFKYYYETSLKMLESKQLLEEQKVKETIFNILKKVIFLSPESLSAIQFKLINVIYEKENIVRYICDFLLSTQTIRDDEVEGKEGSDMACSQLCTDTLTRLVNYANQTNVQTELQAAKNVKDFLFKMSEIIPKVFYNNLSCFVQLLDNEAYDLRNAVVDIMAHIIKYVLSAKAPQGGAEEELEVEERKNHDKEKEKILDALILRFQDKHAFSRSHILTVFIDLCSSDLVPKTYFFPLLICACDRIKDTSANVRKIAIVLLHKIMESYFLVFAASQNHSKFNSLEDLRKEQNFNETKRQELHNEIKQIEQKMSDRENDEKFEEYEHDLYQIKRKIECCTQLQENLDEQIKMIGQVDEVLPNLLELLGSKNNLYAHEIIKLLIYLYQTNIQSAQQGIRKMLVLIWPKEKSGEKEVIKAYWVLQEQQRRVLRRNSCPTRKTIEIEEDDSEVEEDDSEVEEDDSEVEEDDSEVEEDDSEVEEDDSEVEEDDSEVSSQKDSDDYII